MSCATQLRELEGKRDATCNPIMCSSTASNIAKGPDRIHFSGVEKMGGRRVALPACTSQSVPGLRRALLVAILGVRISTTWGHNRLTAVQPESDHAYTLGPKKVSCSFVLAVGILSRNNPILLSPQLSSLCFSSVCFPQSRRDV